MKQSEKLEIYLQWIIDAINKIGYYMKDINIQELEKNHMQLDACLMQFIHIGETANKIVKKYGKLEGLLNGAVKLRNFIAHDYLGIRINLIINTIEIDLPKLKEDILEYLKNN